MSMTEEIEAVQKAIDSGKYNWRTIGSLAKELRLDEKEVREVFETNKHLFRRSMKDDRDGQPLYTTWKRYERMTSRKSVTEIAAEISETKPGDIQKLIPQVMDMLNQYYEEALSQAKKSFIWAVVMAVVGFAFFIISLFILLTFQLQAIAAIGIIGGAIIEAVAGLQFYLYGRTTAQFAYFHQALDRTQKLLVAYNMCEALDGENKQRSLAELVRLVALSAQEMPVASSEQSKSNSS
jgi:hypothetical protein